MKILNDLVLSAKGNVREIRLGDQGVSLSFADTLNKVVKDVNKLQLDAEHANQQLVIGQVEDLHQVILAGEKAELALQMTLQIRNKLVEAYQEMMRMQV